MDDILQEALSCADDVDEVVDPLVNFLDAHSADNFHALEGALWEVLGPLFTRAELEDRLLKSLDKLHYSRLEAWPPLLELARRAARYDELAALEHSLLPAHF